MAITARVGLSIALTKSADGSQLFLRDSTGSYNITSNPLGYGLPGGITSASVTSLVVEAEFQGESTTLTYEFTIASNVITAATLTDIEGTEHNILADMSSTVFPFGTSNLFDLVDEDFDAEMPDMDDQLVNVTYTIAGTFDGEAYEYTTSKLIILNSTVCACLANKWANIDPSCACSDESIWTATKSWAALMTSTYAANVGNSSRAALALEKANTLCEENCQDC